MNFSEILSFVPDNIDIKEGSKIYFAGNKEEFDLYFCDLSEKILSITNKIKRSCTIWYRNHFNSLSYDENQLLSEFLSEVHLVIVPVTRSLLLNADGVMGNEINFAKKYNKPILPVLFENGIIELYSRPEYFGDIQFLNPYENDVTAIPYEKKLTDYLTHILISDDTRVEIQKAFDAYIFLSYRKKDRAQAQKLMRLIHNNDFCRDVAIWYDEYLIPGEDFNRAIEEALYKSKVFALMVTPSVIEPGNYIIRQEYPKAREISQEKQFPILPIECAKTDEVALHNLYENIPPCAMADNSERLSEALRTSLKNVALMKKQDDPVHNYLIGLAYLNGVDVEIDYERAIPLITDAAENKLTEAKRTLVEIYKNGIGVSINYSKALYWTDKLISDYKELFKTDESFGRIIAEAYREKYNLLTIMGEGTGKGEETILNALKFNQYLPIPERIEIAIGSYMALSSIYENQKASEYPLAEQFLYLEDIKKAGIPPLVKAEELAMAHKYVPELAGIIYHLLVGIYSLYFSIENKEKITEYSTKIREFCKEYYPSGLTNFESYCEIDNLRQNIDWTTLDGVEEYMDSYFKNIESLNIHEKSPRALIRFAFDISDIIAFLERTSPEKNLSRFEKYIGKFISIFQGIPLNDSSSDILRLRTRLYTVAADFEKAKENKSVVFTLMNNSRLLSKEIYIRNKVYSNRILYFNVSVETAKSALDFGDADAAFYIINEVYKEWKVHCEEDTSSENQLISTNIYLCFAKCFEKKNKHEDATAFYDEATRTAAILCNEKLSAQNICCLLSAYTDFAWYKYGCGELNTAISLFNRSIESYMLFIKCLAKDPDNLTPSILEGQKISYYYWNNLRGIARAYSETKQLDKEEIYLRALLDLKKDEGGDMWINDHYNLAVCLYCQNRPEEAAPFFEEFIRLTDSQVTAENRYQYAFSLLKAAVYNQAQAREYISRAIDNLLILYDENPDDQQVSGLLKSLLGDLFNKQEEE